MRYLKSMAIALAFGGSSVASAGMPSPAGHYVLNGVMETGSELMLERDGRFHWYLIYGALDLFAEGRWKIEDEKIVLISERGPDLPEPGFDRLVLERDGDTLVPQGQPGAYEHVGAAPD